MYVENVNVYGPCALGNHKYFFCCTRHSFRLILPGNGGISVVLTHFSFITIDVFADILISCDIQYGVMFSAISQLGKSATSFPNLNLLKSKMSAPCTKCSFNIFVDNLILN